VSSIREELPALLAEFAVLSSTTFKFDGRVYRADDPGDGASDLPDDGCTLNTRGLTRLRDLLYTALHCRMSTEAWRSSAYVDWGQEREFVDELSRANVGSGSWEGGWPVRRVEADGAVHVEREGIIFVVPPADVRRPAPSQDETELASVRVPKEQRYSLPGFYFVIGDAEHTLRVEDCVRVYWHIRSDGASALVRSLTTRLNAIGAAFWLKLVAAPQKYERSDAAVLYAPRGAYAAIEPIVAQSYDDVRQHLRDRVSSFALRLAPGLAIAEDPRGNQSFGEHRSAMLARALASVDLARPDRVDAVGEVLARSGLRLDAFHLEPGSLAVYRPLGSAA
jgi:hypothetical protein